MAFNSSRNPILLFAAFMLLIHCCSASAADTPAESSGSKTVFQPAQLQRDYQLAREIYQTLHPSLDRYLSTQQVEQAFSELQTAFSEPQDIKSAFLHWSLFLARLQCGHTRANFLNQPEHIQTQLFEGRDKLPFTFQLIEKRMIVSQDVSQAKLLPGTEILSINQHPVSEIIDAIASYIPSDGSRMAPRYYDMQLTGNGRFEPFDIYFPLLFPPKNGQYRIEYRPPASKIQNANIDAITRNQRATKLTDSDEQQQPPWSFRYIKPDIAYLKIDTFALFDAAFDWQTFIDQHFAELRDKQTPALIIDVRGNSGGLTEIIWHLLSHLASKPLEKPQVNSETAYQTVPENLRPYLKTWDSAFFDVSAYTSPLGNGRYAVQSETDEKSIPYNAESYNGQVILLVDRAASSATFTLAQILKNNQRATLIGEQTGGNQRGITGGAIFFVNLPNTRLEGDLPLIAYQPQADNPPDAGILPDFEILTTVEDIIAGKDSQLDVALIQIAQQDQ